MGDEPMVIADAQGFRVTDAAGKEYLDGISGEWVVNLGYRNPEVAEAAIAQIMRSDFIAPMYNAEPRALLAEKVVEMAPGMSKLLFGLSGSDAVEGAMHLAMRSTGKDEFVCLFQAYHGRTFATLALSYTYPSMYEGAKKGLERYTTRQIRVPNYNCYRCPFERTPDSCDLFCARFVERMIVEGSEGGVAGVIVEAYQANGGMVPSPEGYLQEIREICTRQGAAMIVDEVQTAWGRCGEFFAVQHYGVEPDIIVLGKAFGGGFPMSGVLANERTVQPAGRLGVRLHRDRPSRRGVAIVEIVFTAAVALLLLGGVLFFFKSGGFGLLVDNHGVNGDNSIAIPWQNYVFAATAPIFSLMGWEASADLAEETKDPRRSAPRAMFRAVAVCAAAGLIVMAIFIAAIPTSVPDALEHPNMMFWIVESHFGRVTAVILELIAYASLLGCIVANVAVATRLVYSVSRDGLLPFSEKFGKVSPRWQTPVNANIALWLMCLAVQVVGAGNIFRITSMAVIAYYLTYALTMLGVIVGHKMGRIPEPPKGAGYFGLGKALVPVASIGFLWAMAVVTLYLTPAENHYIIGYFAIALGMGAALTGYAWWALKSGKAKVPVTEVTEEVSARA